MHAQRSAALAAVIAIAATLAAFAHAKMVASVPEDGATVASGLSEIALLFSKPLRLTLVRVHRGTDDKNIPLANALPTAFAASAKVTVAALPEGDYDVSWIAVAEDGHVMKGSFAFTVAATHEPAPAQ
jgi:methionine-rich copper-binding protein CopC